MSGERVLTDTRYADWCKNCRLAKGETTPEASNKVGEDNYMIGKCSGIRPSDRDKYFYAV